MRVPGIPMGLLFYVEDQVPERVLLHLGILDFGVCAADVGLTPCTTRPEGFNYVLVIFFLIFCLFFYIICLACVILFPVSSSSYRVPSTGSSLRAELHIWPRPSSFPGSSSERENPGNDRFERPEALNGVDPSGFIHRIGGWLRALAKSSNLYLSSPFFFVCLLAYISLA